MASPLAHGAESRYDVDPSFDAALLDIIEFWPRRPERAPLERVAEHGPAGRKLGSSAVEHIVRSALDRLSVTAAFRGTDLTGAQ